VFVLSDQARRVCPALAALPCGSRDGHITALGGLPLGMPRQAASQDDEHDRDRGADDVTDDVTHQPVKSPLTMSGPSVRAGFIEAPLIGLANSPSRATVAPTAIAAL
jgi:hypothetical protein